jgi:hypothetical protein
MHNATAVKARAVSLCIVASNDQHCGPQTIGPADPENSALSLHVVGDPHCSNTSNFRAVTTGDWRTALVNEKLTPVAYGFTVYARLVG